MVLVLFLQVLKCLFLLPLQHVGGGWSLDYGTHSFEECNLQNSKATSFFPETACLLLWMINKHHSRLFLIRTTFYQSNSPSENCCVLCCPESSTVKIICTTLQYLLYLQVCHVNLEGQPFYSKKDKPLCKKHAHAINV